MPESGKRVKKPKIATCYTRIDHIDTVRKAYIMWEDLPVAELYHESSSLSGEFDWVIKPIWENWKEAEKRGYYVDIAGIDDLAHKTEYIRRFNPEFVTQRTIPDGRADLYPLLIALKLTYNDLFEVLCRTHGVCGNDELYVSRTPDKVVDIHQQRVPYDIP